MRVSKMTNKKPKSESGELLIQFIAAAKQIKHTKGFSSGFLVIKGVEDKIFVYWQHPDGSIDKL